MDTRMTDSSSAPSVVGRFAPSPSGRMHLGNAFSSLMAWLGARSAGGRMVLRIEDLDPRTQGNDYAQALIDDLRWLGLDWDEGPFYQSTRGAIYNETIDTLTADGLTYPCYCTRAQLHAASAPHASDGTYVYPGTCRTLTNEQRAERAKTRAPAVRLMVPAVDDPAGRVSLVDLVQGPYSEGLAHDCGDFLIRRSDGVVAYQLAVVVDDALMGVTQVVRGRDLLGSAARQSYLYRLLGYDPPTFGHVPLLVAEEGRRLSKRDGDLDMASLRAADVAPERIVGRLAHAVGLAGAHEDASPQKLVERFSWEALAAHPHDIVVKPDFLI